MIGLIYTALEIAVIEDFGEDAWDALLDKTGSEGIYHAVGQYDDADIVAFVGAASELLKLPQEEVLRWFGGKFIDIFTKQWPELFTDFDHVFDFVGSLNDIIHPHVRQFYPKAKVPSFNVKDRTPDQLDVEYVSERSMCHLAEGLILGTAKHYGQSVDVSQTSCKHDGADSCYLVIRVTDSE